ncbi:HDOD domain-containing protein [Desulfovibrio aminophilus]|uniref:EAL and HDOD domain-containing protein n=1 Tax=Desulfovibrio aminophilus TaxID=81425 RepID=UPI00339B33B0
MTQPAQVQQEQPQIEPVFVARQPIFDRAERLWGYELLFRHSAEATSAAFSESSVATSKMVADGFILAQAGLPPACMLFINFPEALLLEGAAYALPREQCVVEILEDVPPTPAILTACDKLKEAGYVLALDDYFGEATMEPFLALADIIKVDLRGKGRAEIEALTRRLAREGRKLLAEKVEDAETHALVKGLGYALFQGFYFSRPETLSGRKVSGAAASRVKLLSELSKEDYETATLSKIISSDAALSYRLLQFINSAYFSRPFKVSSIGQAIAALGQRPLRHWLMAVILSDLSPTPKAKEICANSVQRARLLETLAEHSRHSPRPPDSMFLLGLLSRLDALLGMEMARIISGMPLDDEIADALLGKPNPPRSWLDMATSLETGDWSTAENLLYRLGLEGADTARRQAEAQVWTFQTLTSASASA